MKFEEVLPELRKGKKIRKRFWSSDHYIIYDNNSGDIVNQNGHPYLFAQHDFNYTNWEVIKETKKVKLKDLTEEQFAEWKIKNCKIGCKKCIFQYIHCHLCFDNCWIKHKNLYSDRFLNMEVEVVETEK